MKRGGEGRQLRREEVEAQDDEDEEETQGAGWERASSEELATRRRVRVNRGLHPRNDESNEPIGSSVKPVNPFANVSLVPPGNTGTNKSLPNPFSSSKTTPLSSSSVMSSEQDSNNGQNPRINSGNEAKLKQKMKKLNENFLKFMGKNLLANWKEGLQVQLCESMIQHVYTIILTFF